MQLYAVALIIIWVASITATSDSNVANLSDEKIVQPYVTDIEARSSGQTDTADHSNDAANIGLSRATRTDERESNGVSTINYSSSESIYTTLTRNTDKSPLGEYANRGTQKYTVPEDVLLVESAGSFGQKVHYGFPDDRTTVRTIDDRRKDEYNNFRKSLSSTVSPLVNENDHEKPHISIQELFASKKKNSLPNESTESDKFRLTELKMPPRNFDITSNVRNLTTEISVRNLTSIFENGLTLENLTKSQTSLSHAHNDTPGITKKSTENTKKTESVIIPTSVEISPSSHVVKFAGPIVVPDLPERGVQDIVTDYVDDTAASGTFKSTENSVLPLDTDVRKSKLSNSITSSIMLNPLQVGITLMNADEADLINDREQYVVTGTKGYFQDDLQRLATVNKKVVENKENKSDIVYKDKNFQHVEKEKDIETVTQKVSDDTVEIQKSIELYHTAPIHEIHYPVEYIQQSSLGVSETNNIGSIQKSEQAYVQDQQSELRSNYEAYRGNDAVEKSVVKPHASAFSHGRIRQEYNALEDDAGNPKPSIAEYSSNTREQAPFETLELQPLKYKNVKPVLLLPNQFDDTLYHRSNVRNNLNGNGNSLPVNKQSVGNSMRQEIVSEFVKPYIPSAYQEHQPQPNQAIDQQYSFRSSEARRPEAQQFLLKIVPSGSSSETRFLVPLPRPYPIEKIVEKTVHVPHPIEIEKVIEKKVPVPVPVPQPFPVHVQVPVDRVVEKQIRVPHLYPIHIERVIEKRVPYTFQRLVVQPPSYPMHVRVPATYPARAAAPIERPAHVAASIERPAYVPASTERTTEKLMSSSRPSWPYHTDIERPADNTRLIETKFNKYYQRPHESTFGGESPGPRDTVNGIAFEQPQNYANESQFYKDFYSKPFVYDYNYNVEGKNYVPATQISNVKLMILPKKYGNHVIFRPHATMIPYTIPTSVRRQVVYNLVEKDKAIKDGYVGPVPPRKTFTQGKVGSQTKPSYFSTSATQSPATTAILRRARQPETHYSGSFRQSKMEYGFKPPMIPSVQYDENTATKVED